jgi:hypothetical protein
LLWLQVKRRLALRMPPLISSRSRGGALEVHLTIRLAPYVLDGEAMYLLVVNFWNIRPKGARALLASPRWESRLVHFLKLSGVGRGAGT